MTASATMPVELQGPVDAFNSATRTVTILGVTVGATSIQSFDGTGITDITSFFNTVKVGDLVDISGSQTGGAITWQAMELDN